MDDLSTAVQVSSVSLCTDGLRFSGLAGIPKQSCKDRIFEVAWLHRLHHFYISYLSLTFQT